MRSTAESMNSKVIQKNQFTFLLWVKPGMYSYIAFLFSYIALKKWNSIITYLFVHERIHVLPAPKIKNNHSAHALSYLRMDFARGETAMGIGQDLGR